jgi:hypothetical protein
MDAFPWTNSQSNAQLMVLPEGDTTKLVMETLAPLHCAEDLFRNPSDTVRTARSKIFFMLQGV